MYVEEPGSTGPVRIGRVTSTTRRRIHHHDQAFQRLPYPGRANHDDCATGEDYGISGPNQAGGDRLHGQRVPVLVDEDVRVERWTEIRKQPWRSGETDARR